MARTRVSTTVDEQLLEDARQVSVSHNDAALLDEALSALLDRYKAVEIDDSYKAYDDQPIESPDEWGDLSSFSDAAALS